MRKLVLLTVFLINSINAANIAYVAKIGPGNTATAGVGKEWPNPRFVANGDCIVDKMTGLMWARNFIIGFKSTIYGPPATQPDYTNTDPNLNWVNAPYSDVTLAINNMNNATNKLCGYSDWRIPNVNEVTSLPNYTYTGVTTINWLKTQGFYYNSPIIPNHGVYWTSSVYDSSSDFPANFLIFFAGNSRIGAGGVDCYSSSHACHVLPVRGGK